MLQPSVERLHRGEARTARLVWVPHEMLLAVSLLAAAGLLAVRGAWAPDAWRTIGVFCLLAVLGLCFRFAAQRDSRRHAQWDTLAAFWLAPSVMLAHAHMGPFVSAFHPVVVDAELVRLEAALVGTQLSVLAEPYVPPLLMDLLLACYYSYFVLPIALGALLFRRNRAGYERYVYALTLCYVLTFVGYVLVPAIGPRFYLAEEFTGPLRGVWLTAPLDGWMRLSPFLMDCFPSGHTGITLVMWTFAARYHPRFFRFSLPIGLGLIAATVLGRFHYSVDLLAAVPVAAACVVIGMLGRRVPSRRAGTPSQPFREPLHV